MSSAATLSWFVRHEIRLAWREWLAMMTGGRRKRKRAGIGVLLLAGFPHLPAQAGIRPLSGLGAPLDKPAPIALTPTPFLARALIPFEAIESVDRRFYA